MTRRIAFILNEKAGSNDAAVIASHRARIEEIANGGPVSTVHSGDDIRQKVQQAIADGCEAVVAGGGDGTLNAVASQLVGTSIVFGVLPLGTLNHFAQDVGIPLDIDSALDVIARGETDRVDVGEISGRHFLNNASLGLYVRVVRHRDRQQAKLGRGKWPAFAWALWSALRRFPFMTLQMCIDGRESRVRSPFLFIGNNRYETSGLGIGRRQSLQSGALSVYLAQRAGRRRLFVLALHALLGRLGPSNDFQVFEGQQLQIFSDHMTLQVATDGEVTRLPTPLECRIHARALQVYLPARGLEMAVLVHLSDLHFGRVDERLVEPLLATVAAARPDVVVVSGDLTQRARRAEFEAARDFVDRLPRPRVIVPGNHDVPLYNVLDRLVRPLASFRRFIEADPMPWFANGELVVVGVNTARSVVIKNGRINREQIDAIRAAFEGVPADVLRVVVTHHPFDAGEAMDAGDRVGRAEMAMQAFDECGVDLLLSGHLHVAYSGATIPALRCRGALAVSAGTATSTRVRGDPNEFNVLRVDKRRIEVERQTWDETTAVFRASASIVFERTADGWAPATQNE